MAGFFNNKPRDHCGVFGIFDLQEDVARLTFYGLLALQHRGQESAGIASSDLKKVSVHKDMGLVNQVFGGRFHTVYIFQQNRQTYGSESQISGIIQKYYIYRLFRLDRACGRRSISA